MNETVLLALAIGLAVLAIVLVFAMRTRADPKLSERLDELARGNERLERELRAAVEAAASGLRMETGTRLGELQSGLVQQVTGLGGVQGQQLHDFSARMQQQLADLTHAIQLNLGEVRTTLQGQLTALQQGNETKLDQMRATVEEKLQSTLEARLGESFKLVSERLEQVHRGLGEMQSLAAGVGDLKRVLSNVKSRGTFGEVQLAVLLEQVMAADQYAANVVTRPGSNERVEFAIRMPGRDDGRPVWLPIDAKFPSEDYERILAAQESADREAFDAAARALENRIRLEAKTMREKYVEPPHTTDFAILFLPTEGLFAEVLRRPGLTEALNRELRVVVAGPTTLFAMLNSLQMGFRTLALEKRSAEVWQVLGAVKTEFAKFGDVLVRLKAQLQTASNTIDQAETRTRQMTRALRSVEALPAEQAAQLLPPERSEDG
ncbi:MAG TPA: DNA recombination protein RmuC [Burkholderiaceae bacterium]|nr:DNA recombination protein RmuC [Burkholderiaceae bacterium]HQR76061.1 DNA recombination protein RmuC [Burkholderiaceae bacterium]